MRPALWLCLALLVSVTVIASPAWAKGNNPMIQLETSMGNIILELDAENAPKSSENFIKYVEEGAYDGTIFHRIIDGFMVQGGGFDENMDQRPTHEPIENEADNGLKNDKYTIAMARTADPHSATAQFFINVNDNTFLNHSAKTMQGWGYAVFGKVVDGTDVVDAIKSVPTGTSGFHENVPMEAVVIKKATLIEK